MTGGRSILIGDIGVQIRRWLKRALPAVAILLLILAGWLFLEGNPGAPAFALIAVGTYLVLNTWCTAGISVPILPMLAVQHLIAYGLPIAVRHEIVTAYPPEFVFAAGVEVLIFSVSLAAAWRMGLYFFVSAGWSCYGLQGFSGKNTTRLQRMGFMLVAIASGYLLLQTTGWLDHVFSVLPSGLSIVATTLAAAVGSCGFFLIAMLIGAGEVSGPGRFMFWIALAANCLIQASGLLLSAATTIVASVLIGLFWGSGRLPWRYLIIVVSVLAYLSLGKYTMRQIHWHEGNDSPPVPLVEMPSHYAEWASVSLEALKAKQGGQANVALATTPDSNVSLFERINNLQNLLFVIDAMEIGHIPPLDGVTYTIIPKLFVPRFLWADKPRTHEGQVILNVHFGRQDLESSEHTYIAWGLLPEAYGNFGPYAGAVALGATLGLLLAWVEKATTRKLVLSLEGFLLFTFFLGMTNSFEMVGSVLATTLFQGMITVVIAAGPFVARVDVRKLISAPA